MYSSSENDTGFYDFSFYAQDVLQAYCIPCILISPTSCVSFISHIINFKTMFLDIALLIMIVYIPLTIKKRAVRVTILFYQFFFQRTAVYTDSYRNISLHPVLQRELLAHQSPSLYIHLCFLE